MTKNNSLIGRDYWKNFFKYIFQIFLTLMVAGLVGGATESAILAIMIFVVGLIYFSRLIYLKNRSNQREYFQNKLLETGEYDLGRLNSMSVTELNLRSAFHGKLDDPNASNLPYDQFKALAKAKGKEAIGSLVQATGTVIGALGAAAETITNSSGSEGSMLRYTCRNCGRKATIGQACPVAKGAICVPVEMKKDSFDARYTCRNCGRKATISQQCPATNGGFCIPVGNS